MHRFSDAESKGDCQVEEVPEAALDTGAPREKDDRVPMEVQQ